MSGPLLVLLLVALCCAVVAVARFRRIRYLRANRPRVIKESLERARAKQALRGRGPEGPGTRKP